jgi:hypothetical protein
VFAAGLRLNLSTTDEDYPAPVLANYMLGGGFLNSPAGDASAEGQPELRDLFESVRRVHHQGRHVRSECHRRAANVGKVEAAVKRNWTGP